MLRATIRTKGKGKEAWVSRKPACSISIKVDKLCNMTYRKRDDDEGSPPQNYILLAEHAKVKCPEK